MNEIAFSAPHHLATKAGYSMLEKGASAVDAMIAAAATIAVVYPHMNSWGGDGFWLIHKPGEAPVAIDACGVAGAGATLGRYAGKASIPSRGGPAALTMAGTLDGWRLAREWQHKACIVTTPLNELFAPAIALANDGITVTRSLQMASEKVAPELGEMAGYQKIFCPNGRPLQAGEILYNPGMGRFLGRIAESGTDDFYHGALAIEFSDWLQSEGSPITLADFNAYRAQMVTPLQVSLSGADVYNLPPPTQGIASLLILAIYDWLFRKYKPSTENLQIHLLVEACKQAFIVRDKLACDPSRLQEGWKLALEKDAVQSLAEQIDITHASPWPRTAKPGDTVWMGAVDSEGCMVSFIQSIYWEFGSGLIHPDYGISWNNRGTSFSLVPGHINQLEPGCKPFHTLNPAFATFSDGRRLAYGTMGGEGQPQTQAAVFSRYHYLHMGLDAAISRGRWLLGRTWGDQNSDLKLEADLANAVGAGLQVMGHKFRIVPENNEMMGHAGAVLAKASGKTEAATDPRSDGAAIRGQAQESDD